MLAHTANPATGLHRTLHVGDCSIPPFCSDRSEKCSAFLSRRPLAGRDFRLNPAALNYVQPFPGPGGKWQMTPTDGGTEPVWNPNGRELFYHNGTKLMAVGITTQPAFSVSKPHVLFEGNRHMLLPGKHSPINQRSPRRPVFSDSAFSRTSKPRPRRRKSTLC